MESLMRYKGTIIGLLLLVGLFFVYANFIKGTDNDPLLTSEQVAGVDGSAAGEEIIAILNELKRIRLDTSLFENEKFNSLVDRRVDIESESVGRNNPFDPIGFGINIQNSIAKPSEEVIQLIDTQNKVKRTSTSTDSE